MNFGLSTLASLRSFRSFRRVSGQLSTLASLRSPRSFRRVSGQLSAFGFRLASDTGQIYSTELNIAIPKIIKCGLTTILPAIYLNKSSILCQKVRLFSGIAGFGYNAGGQLFLCRKI